ncbi:MAG: polysaccharide biosynthesis/export family protein [Bacteroidia bacterium]|nr:polysaccharide biosynthesis/export family protein [Bacteroidia bacterium]HQV01791.1 polysaccharide biosynthesis/export family protein [Bacteroidia bacterium]
MKFFNSLSLALISIVFLIMAGCIPQKKIVYFQDKTEGKSKDKTSLATPIRPDMIIYKKDIVNVLVYTENPDALPGIGSKLEDRTMDNRPAYERGFTVEDNGDLVLPLIGPVPVAGLTVDQAKQEISKRYKKYVANPVVVVKKLSFKISVLGEVAKPGMYFINYESISLLEALSLAGDLTKYGSRTDVKVIRVIDGRQEEFVIDLTDNKTLYSKLFYLKQDDVIYVRQLKNKRWADAAPQVSIVTSVTTVLIALGTLLIVRAK